MKYRSSVKWFIQEVLRSLDQRGHGPAIHDVPEENLVPQIEGAVERIRKEIPPEDWDEIVQYIIHYRRIHGDRSLGIESKFWCWLAAVGVELLADL